MNETFKGTINGETFSGLDNYNEFVKSILEIDTNNVNISYEFKSEQPLECNCEKCECKALTRPERYATDLEYIIPNLDEINFGNIDSEKVLNDLEVKLTKRMEYYTQEKFNESINHDLLVELLNKATKNSILLEKDLNGLDKMIDVLGNGYVEDNLRESLSLVKDAMSSVLGFYDSMIVEFDEYLAKMEVENEQKEFDKIINLMDEFNLSENIRNIILEKLV